MLGNYKQIFSGSLIVFGVIGLLISLLGEVTSLGEYKSLPPRMWERYDQKLVNETPDIVSLEKKYWTL